MVQPFTLLIKPSGSDCNIECRYCFYKARDPRFGRGSQRMSEAVLNKMVRDYMVKWGIDSSRIQTISYGESVPLDRSGTEEAWAKNRRAHFAVIQPVGP